MTYENMSIDKMKKASKEAQNILYKYAVEASLDSIHIKHKDMLDPKNYSLEECGQFGLMDV